MISQVLVFGTFDNFDAGHQFVISEASRKGRYLVVAIARDEHVRVLKQKVSLHSEKERLERVAADKQVSRTILSDEQLGSYQILDDIKPDLIILGFDQNELKADLLRWMSENNRSIPIETLDYCPE